MTWKGRIIGTIIGLFFGGFGAIIGFSIGYFFHDKQKNEAYNEVLETRNAFSGRGNKRYEHELIIKSTFRLMGYVSRGAGRINESHIKQSEHIMRAMNLDEHMRELAIESFNYGKSDSFDLRDEALKLRGIVGSNITMLAFLMEIQVGVAIADEELTQGEHERLLNIAIAMDVPVSQMEKLIKVRLAEQQFSRFARDFYESRSHQQQEQGYQDQEQGHHGYQEHSSYHNQGSYQDHGSYQEQEHNYSNNSRNEYQERSYSQHENSYSSQSGKSELSTAYEILGVTANTPWDEIRKAHKKLMLKYHPDRLAAQGLPPEMVTLYTQKAQDIQAAFNLIKKYHGK